MPEQQRRPPQTRTGRERDYNRRDGSEVAPLKLAQRVEQEHGEAIYQPTFPAIWRDEHLTYVKGYDVFFTDYLLAKDGFPPLINYEHYGLYCDLYFAAERGESWKHNVFASLRDISPVTLKTMLDRLEDVNLMTRIRCMSPGQPVMMVLRTPYTSSELGKHRADLHRRIEKKHTASGRAAAARGQWPRLVWDRGLVEQLVKGGAKVKAIMIVKAVMGDLNSRNPKGEKLSTSEGYFQELKRLCAENRVKLDRKMYETALTFFALREGWST